METSAIDANHQVRVGHDWRRRLEGLDVFVSSFSLIIVAGLQSDKAYFELAIFAKLVQQISIQCERSQKF